MHQFSRKLEGLGCDFGCKNRYASLKQRIAAILCIIFIRLE